MNIFGKENPFLLALYRGRMLQNDPQIRGFSAVPLHFGYFLIPDNQNFSNYHPSNQTIYRRYKSLFTTYSRFSVDPILMLVYISHSLPLQVVGCERIYKGRLQAYLNGRAKSIALSASMWDNGTSPSRFAHGWSGIWITKYPWRRSIISLGLSHLRITSAYA